MANRLYPLIPLLAALLVVCDDAGSQGPPQDVGIAGDGNLDAVLEAVRIDHDLPALAAVSVHDGAIVELGTAGVRAVGYQEQVTDADVWHIGSLTKAITATLAAVLVEDGLLTWDTTVGQVFPDLVASVHPQYIDVRLDELLYHTGGLPVDVSRAPSWGSRFTDTSEIRAQRRDFAAELLALPPNGPRGTFAYSNAGYVVAGAMLEQVTGQAWENLLTGNVFDPLGMSSCGFGPPGGPGRDEPWGHQGEPGDWRAIQPGPYADNPAVLGPAGTVHCSLADYAAFMIEHLAGDAGVAGIVSPAGFAVLHAPPTGSDYAMGWAIATRAWADGRVLNHSGSNTMWLASVWLAPERNLGLFGVANAGDDAAFAGVDAAITALLKRFEAASNR